MTRLPTTRSTRNNTIKLCVATAVMGFILDSAAFPQGSNGCRKWIERVTATPKHDGSKTSAPGGPAVVIPNADPWDVASLSDSEKLKGIGCLLAAESDTNPAAFSGSIRFDISQTFAPAKVNLAALYAISYLYTGNFDHAAAVALRGEGASFTDSRGNYVTKGSAIHKAYLAYRTWFKKVQAVGLTEALHSDLQPLRDTGLSWY